MALLPPGDEVRQRARDAVARALLEFDPACQLLTREILYTAVTRTRRTVRLWHSPPPAALASAIPSRAPPALSHNDMVVLGSALWQHGR